jgi:hypothetical protein
MLAGLLRVWLFAFFLAKGYLHLLNRRETKRKIQVRATVRARGSGYCS